MTPTMLDRMARAGQYALLVVILTFLAFPIYYMVIT